MPKQQSKPSRHNQQEIDKSAKSLKNLGIYLTGGIIYLIILIAYQTWQLSSRQVYLAITFILMAPLAVSVWLLFLAKRSLAKKSKKALWYFIAACALNFVYSLFVEIVLGNQGFSILLVISLFVPALLFIMMYSLVKKGILV